MSGTFDRNAIVETDAPYTHTTLIQGLATAERAVSELVAAGAEAEVRPGSWK